MLRYLKQKKNEQSKNLSNFLHQVFYIPNFDFWNLTIDIEILIRKHTHTCHYCYS